MNTRQFVLGNLFSIIPTIFIEKLTKTNILYPLYHIISDNNVKHVKHVKHLYYYKNVKQFEEDLSFLLKYHKPIDLFQLIDYVKNNKSIPKRSFFLSFDDGFKEMYDIVAPILLKKGIPATFFINSDFVDNKNLCFQHKASILVDHLNEENLDRENIKKIKYILNNNNIISSILNINYNDKNKIDDIAKLLKIDFKEYLSKFKPYLSSEQIIDMMKKGFTFGAHSIDHPLYAILSLTDQLEQTIQSLKFIKEKFGLSYGVFAFPHNDLNVSEVFFEKIYQTGLVDISFGTRGIIKDSIKNNIQRFGLEENMSAKKIVAYHLSRKLVKSLFNKDIVISLIYS